MSKLREAWENVGEDNWGARFGIPEMERAITEAEAELAAARDQIERLKSQLKQAENNERMSRGEAMREIERLTRERDEALKASEGYREYAAEKSNQYVQACRERDEARNKALDEVSDLAFYWTGTFKTLADAILALKKDQTNG